MNFMRGILLSMAVLAASCSVNHFVRWPGERLPSAEAVVLSVHDGDTISVSVDESSFSLTGPSGIRPQLTNHIRILFIDTMESARNARMVRLLTRLEKEGTPADSKSLLLAGEAARVRLSELLPPGSTVELEFQGPDKVDIYGRWLCGVFLGPTNLAHLMVSEGLAVVYEGPSQPTPASGWYLRALRECCGDARIPAAVYRAESGNSGAGRKN